MNTRERLLIGAVAVLGLGFIGDRLLLAPLLEWHGRESAAAADLQRKIDDASALTRSAAKIEQAWRTRLASGLLEGDEAVQYRVQRLLAEAGAHSGLRLDNAVGGQRVAGGRVLGQDYDLLRFTCLGRGTLAQALAFTRAIGESAVPLRVERCEWSSRDGRRDEVDLTLTLSVPLRALKAEPVRVPASTRPWQPAARDGGAEAAVLAAKPFLVDRKPAAAPRPAPAPTPRAETPPPPPPTPGSDWVLVGIATRDGAPSAFVRSLSGTTEREIPVGGEVAGGKLLSVGERSVEVAFDGKARSVGVGYTLAGQPYTFGKPSSSSGKSSGSGKSSSSSSAAPAGASGAGNGAKPSAPAEAGGVVVAVPAEAAPATEPAPAAKPTDAEREAILERLRQQRNRSQ